MAADRALPLAIRARVLATELRKALRKRRPRRAIRAVAGFAFPSRWATDPDVRAAALDEAVRSGSLVAARRTVADTEGVAEGRDGPRPGGAVALRRARALELLASRTSGRERETEDAVVAYLRGELGPPAKASSADPAPAATAAASAAATAAAALRAAGHPRPRVLATLPGFKTNPYGRLMEQAFASLGLAAVPVERAEEIERVVHGSREGGYEAVVHVNAPDRLVREMGVAVEPGGAAERVLADVDRWLAMGASLVVSIHNLPRLRGPQAEAERLVAQGLVDRASLVHLLSAETQAALGFWINLDPSRCVHIPHPSYDGAYDAAPDRAEARGAIGVGESDVVAGLVGTLAWRKEAELLVDALAAVPDPLPDGRRLRVVLAGMLLGSRGETLIRRAMADPRVIARFGYVPDEAIPGLLAALDVAVVPYERFLNSGWLHLALTAGVPVIASDGGNAAEVARPEALRIFRAGDAGSLASHLTAVGELTTPDARAAARASVRDLDPAELSARFARAVIAATAAGPGTGDAPKLAGDLSQASPAEPHAAS